MAIPDIKINIPWATIERVVHPRLLANIIASGLILKLVAIPLLTVPLQAETENQLYSQIVQGSATGAWVLLLALVVACVFVQSYREFFAKRSRR